MGFGSNGREKRRSRDEYAPQDEYRPQTDSRPQRDKPSWTVEAKVEQGDVIGELTSRVGDRGDKLFSFSVGRRGREPGFTSKFFQLRDIKDLRDVINALEKKSGATQPADGLSAG